MRTSAAPVGARCTAVTLVLIAVSSIIVHSGNCLQFNYPNFGNNYTVGDILFEATTDVLIDSTAWLLPNPDPSWETDHNDTSATVRWTGWMAYNQPIPFLGTNNNNNGKAHSFNTSFTFKLITGGYGDSPSGMAFFIAPTANHPNGTLNGFFGIGNTTFPANFFALEFDTYESQGTNDPSASHIGIDISNINSSKWVDTSSNSSNPYYPELYLYNNYTFKAWISYDGSLELTKVWMTNETADYADYQTPPADLQPIMEYEEDLSHTFSKGDMYVGFSAATESDYAMLGVAIYSWYFSISDNPAAHVGAPDTSPGMAPEVSVGSPPTPPSPPTLTYHSPPAPPPQSSANSEKQLSSSLLLIPFVIIAFLV